MWILYFYRKLEYLHDNRDIPIYERTSKAYSAKEVTEILLDVNLPTTRIATKQPVSVQENLVFIVDLSHLEKPEDVRADDLGSWACNGKRTTRCVVEDGCVLEVTPGVVSQANRQSYLLVKRYYKHIQQQGILEKQLLK